ncbi:MAG: energy transducer TonB [Saprospiraceae bacterium]
MLNPFDHIIQNQFWNDLIFINRNKEYGAYQHRAQYNRRMFKGILASVLIFILLIFSTTLKNWYNSLFDIKADDEFQTHEITMSSPPSGNKGEDKLPLLTNATKSVEKSEKNIPKDQFPTKVIKSDPEIKIEPKKDQKDINEKKESKDNTSTENGQTSSNQGSANAHGDSLNSGQVYKIVSQMPVFAGCEELGGTYLEKKKCSEQRLLGFLKSNLKYPTQALRNKTAGVVLIQFIVEKNGSISNIIVLKDIGDGCGSETTRVLELMNTMKLYWTPGHQGANSVRVQYTLPVEFEGG